MSAHCCETGTYLSKSPLLILLLQTGHDDGHDREGVLEHLIGYFPTLLCSVNLLQDPLVDGRALSAKPGRHLEAWSLGGRQCQHLLRNRLQKLNALLVRLDIEVVVVTFFLDPMESLFIPVLSVSNEPAILRRPGRMGGPFIIQDRVAEFITAAAGLETLLCDSVSLGLRGK
jgi:hypothetical protein